MDIEINLDGILRSVVWFSKKVLKHDKAEFVINFSDKSAKLVLGTRFCVESEKRVTKLKQRKEILVFPLEAYTRDSSVLYSVLSQCKPNFRGLISVQVGEAQGNECF